MLHRHTHRSKLELKLKYRKKLLNNQWRHAGENPDNLRTKRGDCIEAG